MVSQVREFVSLQEFMDDKQLDKCLELVVKLIMKPDVPASKAVPLIVELQALSAKFAILGTQYQTYLAGPAKSDNAHKKNLYKTLSPAIDRLVDALKFSAKQGY
jgi:hypothetical protein